MAERSEAKSAKRSFATLYFDSCFWREATPPAFSFALLNQFLLNTILTTSCTFYLLKIFIRKSSKFYVGLLLSDSLEKARHCGRNLDLFKVAVSGSYSDWISVVSVRQSLMCKQSRGDYFDFYWFKRAACSWDLLWRHDLTVKYIHMLTAGRCWTESNFGEGQLTSLIGIQLRNVISGKGESVMWERVRFFVSCSVKFKLISGLMRLFGSFKKILRNKITVWNTASSFNPKTSINQPNLW